MRVVSVFAAAVVVGAIGLGTTAVAVAAPAWRPVPETGAPGRLVLDVRSDGDTLVLPSASDPAPVTWGVRTRVTTADPVVLDLRVRREGRLTTVPDGLVLSVSACEDPDCRTGSHVLVPPRGATERSDDASAVRIPDPDQDGTAYLVVRIALAAPDSPELVGAGGRVGIGVTARAVGPVARADAGGPEPLGGVLAFTGGGFAGPLLVALAAVLAGVGVRLRRRGSS